MWFIQCIAQQVVFLLLLLGVFGQAQQTKGDQEAYPHFIKIKELWEKEEYRHLQKFLGERVTLHLGKIYVKHHSNRYPLVKKIRGRYSRQQAIGILRDYFETVEIQEFAFYSKKLKRARAVVSYKYRLVHMGIEKQKLMYINLKKAESKEQADWVIESIHIIG